jgi:carbamoyltransferase
MVLEEEADKWFDMDFDSPYMQYAVRCLKPELIPSVVHKDGTSRVQTVNKEQHPDLHELLLRWYKISGVPVLLNTSLNIKGQPLLNDRIDIQEWEKMYNFKILTGNN